MRPIFLAFVLSLVACDEAHNEPQAEPEPPVDGSTGLPVWEVDCDLGNSIVIFGTICGRQRFTCNTGRRMDLWFTQESPGVCIAVTLTGSCAMGPGPGRSELTCSNDVGTWSAWVLDAP